MLKRSLFSIFHADITPDSVFSIFLSSDSVFSIFFTSHSVFSIFNVRLRVFHILYSVFSIFYTPCFPFFDVTLRGSDSETPAPELKYSDNLRTNLGFVKFNKCHFTIIMSFVVSTIRKLRKNRP